MLFRETTGAAGSVGGGEDDDIISDALSNRAPSKSMTTTSPSDYDNELTYGGMSHTVDVELAYRWIFWSCVSHTLQAPLERVRFVMQTQKELQRLDKLRTDFNTAWSCVRYLYRIEGCRSFWRGNAIQMLSFPIILVSSTFVFTPVYDFIRFSWPMRFLCGELMADNIAYLCGYAVSTVIFYPLIFARFRFATDIKPYKGSPYMFGDVLTFLSQSSFIKHPHRRYTGLMISLFSSTVYLGVYHWITSLLDCLALKLPDRTGKAALLSDLSYRLIASTGAVLVLHPFELVRFRVMFAVTEEKLRYPSVMHCMLRVAKQEGIRGFYRGWTVSLAKLVYMTGLMQLGFPSSL